MYLLEVLALVEKGLALALLLADLGPLSLVLLVLPQHLVPVWREYFTEL